MREVFVVRLWAYVTDLPQFVPIARWGFAQDTYDGAVATIPRDLAEYPQADFATIEKRYTR